MAIKKIIQENKPTPGDKGQYNFDTEKNAITGYPLWGNVFSKDLDLYTSVLHQKSTAENHPQGNIWNYKGSQIELVEIKSAGHLTYDSRGQGFFDIIRFVFEVVDFVLTGGTSDHWNWPETDDHYRNSKWSVYLFDDLKSDFFSKNKDKLKKATDCAFSDTGFNYIDDHFTEKDSICENEVHFNGNTIRDDAIGKGNSFDNTGGNNRVYYHNNGSQNSGQSLGNILRGGSVELNDFPVNPTIASPEGGSGIIGDFDKDLNDWQSAISGEIDSSLYLVVRISADEKEVTMLGLSTATDKLNRTYSMIRIPKRIFYEGWRTGTSNTITLEWGNKSAGSSHRWHNPIITYSDGYGGRYGYSFPLGWDHNEGVNKMTYFKIRITTPDWSINKANKSKTLGGTEANYIDYSEFPDSWWAQSWNPGELSRGFNPLCKELDFTGCWENDWYYGTSDTRFFRAYPVDGHSSEDTSIYDFRPVSTVESNFINVPQQSRNLQSYYELYTSDSYYSSVPVSVKLTMDVIERPWNSTGLSQGLDYIEFDQLASEGKAYFRYWYYVVNWDWKDGDPGGGACEQSNEIIHGLTYNSLCFDEIGAEFPVSEEDLIVKQDKHNIYKLAEIYSGGGITYPTTLEHYYYTPGIKTIKVIVFSTKNCSKAGFTNFRQAVRWKLVDVKINLGDDLTTIDFEDVGGDGYVFLPYPDLKLDSLGYRTNHPIISGLSENSTYYSSISSLYNSPAQYSIRDNLDLVYLQKAYGLLPNNTYDEWGRFLGETDLYQVRLFNKPYDMKDFLNIHTVYDAFGQKAYSDSETGIDDYGILFGYGDVFHPYFDSIFWNGDITDSRFVEESPVGDIFIDEYDYFKNDCLFELNFDELDGVTVRDSSGNGNKGIVFGDYSITKNSVTEKAVRDSYMEFPEIEESSDKGAL